MNKILKNFKIFVTNRSFVWFYIIEDQINFREWFFYETQTFLSAGRGNNEIRIQYPDRKVFTRLDRLGIMTMDPVSGDFQPLNFLTRAEAAKIVIAMRAVENPVSEAGVFSEVPSDHWAYPYVGTALEWGIVSGTGDGIFQPDREITQSKFMKMLVSLLGK